jgi:hypothetical protein
MKTVRKAIRSLFSYRTSMNARTAHYERMWLRAHLFGAGF